jgi:hypothetical protein
LEDHSDKTIYLVGDPRSRDPEKYFLPQYFFGDPSNRNAVILILPVFGNLLLEVYPDLKKMPEYFFIFLPHHLPE